MIPTFMILPSMSRQASCKYCFGPHKGAVMNETTAKKTAAFVHQIRKECGGTKLTVIFHGGEPLLAPISVWEVLLYELTALGVETDLSIQSNLWALGDAFLELFRKYNVKIGTSLDGPCEICDRNRGDGYYGHTMTGMKKAREAGIPVNAIATLTRQTAPDAEEILTFFRNEGISPVLHCAIKSLDEKDSPYALTPDEYADTLIRLYPWYIKNRKYLKIRTLDSFCRGAVLGDPRICTFGDCSNLFLAISPTGALLSHSFYADENSIKTARKENIACHVPKKLSSEWRKMDATLSLLPLHFHFFNSGLSAEIL